ncbi:C25 family cysteine peptidase [Verrucomicrobiota bacterium sgz303538]
MNNDKVIVTNFAALKAKYGATGLSAIQKGLKALIATDKTEGLTTQVVDLSDAAQMTKLKGKAVTVPLHQRQVKTAIDAVYKAIVPAYILILGSTDVVPHQDLTNPVSDPEAGDPDPVVPSDLPYACDVPYNQDPAKFIGPTRVIGRLPDLTAATDPTYLLSVIQTAAQRKSRPPQDYSTFLGITAWEWRKSTELSLQRIFGSGKTLQTSPKTGPQWTVTQLSSRSHFINCHGSIAKPHFYGQQGETYPVAHRTTLVNGKLANGTVAAVECCYGGLLYDPLDAQGVMSICHAYLGSGAYGYCGSTTVAYGPEEGNAQADLLCRYFLQRVLAGSSLGRAMLEARQQFAQSAAQLDPFDLKTLVQFNLLGDPSIHPVVSPSTHKTLGKVLGAVSDIASRAVNRADRRRLLIRTGEQIQSTQLVPERLSETAVSGPIAKSLKNIAREAGINGDGKVLTFSIGTAAGQPLKAKPKGAFAKLAAPEVFHVVSKRVRGVDDKDIGVAAVVAREVNGQIVSYRKVVSR